METANSIVVGATPSTANSSYWSNGSIPWLPSGCCQDCDVLESYPKMKRITEKAYESCSTIMMEPETVLIALTGATAGKVGLLKFKACANQSVVGIKPYLDINVKFLFYQLMARRKEILSDCIGSAQPHISKEYVTKINFALPPLLEQQRIVDRIEQIEPLLQQYDKLEKQLTKLENEITDKLKKSILQYAIEGKLVKQDPNDEPASVLLERIKAEKEKLIKEVKIKRDKNESYIYQGDDKNYYEKNNNTLQKCDDIVGFLIPKEWSFAYVENVTSYGFTNLNRKAKIGDWLLELEDIECKSSKIINRKYLTSKTNLNSKVVFNKGMILYSKLRPYLDKVLVADCDGVATSEIVPFYSFIYPDYLIILLKSPYFLTRVTNLMYGVKMPRLGTTDMCKTIIPISPINEQKRIINKLKILFQNIDY